MQMRETWQGAILALSNFMSPGEQMAGSVQLLGAQHTASMPFLLKPVA